MESRQPERQGVTRFGGGLIMTFSAGNVAQMVWGGSQTAATGSAVPPGATGHPAINLKDMSGYQVGLQDGWTTKDVAPGKYEIFDQGGQSLGFGYKGLDDTLSDYQRQNIMGSAKQVEVLPDQSNPWLAMRPPEKVWQSDLLLQEDSRWGDLGEDEDGNRWLTYNENGERMKIDRFSPKNYDSEDAILADLQKIYDAAARPGDVYIEGGDLAKWEALGNILAGADGSGVTVKDLASQGLADYYGDALTQIAPGVLTQSGGVRYSKSGGVYSPGASNHAAAAANAHGLPTTYRGNMPATERTEHIAGEQTLYGTQPVFKDGKLVGYKMDQTVLSPEEIADYEARNHVTSGGKEMYPVIEPNAFVSEWARRSSQTVNAVARKYKDGWDGVSTPIDLDGNVFIPVEKISEIPGWENVSTASYDNWAGGGSILGSVIGAVVSFWFPVAGAVISAASAAHRGDGLGVLTSMIPLAGNVTGTIGSAITGGTNAVLNNAIGSGVIGAGSTALRGGSGSDILKSGLLSGASSYVGGLTSGYLKSEGMGDLAAKIGGGAAAQLTRVGGGLLLSNKKEEKTPQASSPSAAASTAQRATFSPSSIGRMVWST